MGSTIFSGDKVATLKDKLAIGKDSTAPQILNSTTNPTTSAVSAPLGSLLINRSTGEIYKKLDAGSSTNWELITAGGAGGINYIKNPDFEVGTADTSVSTGCSVATQTTNKLRGTQSLEVTFASSATSSSYVGIDMSDLDPQDVGKNLWISFDYSEDGNMAADDYEVVLYNNDNSTEEIVVGEFLPTGALTTRSRFVGRASAFETVANSDYEIRIRSKVSRGSTNVLHIDNVRVAPDALVPGAIVTEWQSYTPSLSGTLAIGNGTLSALYRRVGDSVEIMMYWLGGSTTTWDTNAWEFGIPSGLAIDTAKMAGGTDNTDSVGIVYANDITGTLTVGSVIANQGADTFYVFSEGTTGSWRGTIPFTWATGDWFSLRCTIPIEGWSSGAMLSTTEANLQTVQAIAYDNASGANTAFASGATEIITYDNVVVDTHNSITTGASWKFTAPRKANYAIDANIIWSTNANLTQTLLYVYKNGSLAAWLDAGYTNNHIQGSTVIPLEKGDYIDVRAAPTTSDVSARNPDGSTTSSRVAITSLPDFSTFSVYGETEYKEVLITADTNYNNGSYTDVTGASIALTPGEWQLGYEIFNFFDWTTGSSLGVTASNIITDSSNNVVTGSAGHRYHILNNNDDQIGTSLSMTVNVTVTEADTYKVRGQQSGTPTANVQVTANGTASTGDSKFWARRIK